MEEIRKQIAVWRDNPAHQGRGYTNTAAWVPDHTSGWWNHLRMLEDDHVSFPQSHSQLPASNLENQTITPHHSHAKYDNLVLLDYEQLCLQNLSYYSAICFHHTIS